VLPLAESRHLTYREPRGVPASSSKFLLGCCVSGYTRRTERPDHIEYHPRQPPNKRRVIHIASWRKPSAFQDHARGGAIRNSAMTQRHGCYNCADEISDSRPTPTSEEQHTLDLAGVSVGATIGLREARKWRGRYACGVIVKGAAIRAEGEALRHVEFAGVVTTVGELRDDYDSLGYGACGPLIHW
jgi:hypothetical protein